MEGETRPVDVHVLEEVRDAARARAGREGQALAAIARAALWHRAQQYRDGVEVAEPVPLTPASDNTVRFRFFVPQQQYRDARAALAEHGETVVDVVEQAFSKYARTGEMT